MIVQCPKCGNLVSDKATVCPSCGASLTAPRESAPPEKAEEKEAPIKQPEVKEPEPIPDKPSGEGWYQEPEKKKTGVSPILLSILLAVVILGVGGFFVYNNVIKPRQIDKAAPQRVPALILIRLAPSHTGLN